TRRPACGRGYRDRRAVRAVRMPRGHRRGLAACPDGPARRGRRPCTHRVREGEASAPLVALAGGRVPRVGVVRGELIPVLFEPLPRPGRCNRHVPRMTIARDMDTPTLLARWAWFVGGGRYGSGLSARRAPQ